MEKSSRQATFIQFDETVIHVRRLIETLKREGAQSPELSASASADASLVEKLPAWVARYGALVDGSNAWVYCEPRFGTRSGQPGQIQLRNKTARCLIDTFDASSGACVARESAGGTPLVAGLAFTGRPLLLWIRPMS